MQSGGRVLVVPLGLRLSQGTYDELVDLAAGMEFGTPTGLARLLIERGIADLKRETAAGAPRRRRR
jgi:hypothetical protein